MSHARLSRRAFLQASAAAAPLVGVGLLLPTTALAADRSRDHILVPSAGRWIDPDPHALAQRGVDAAVAAGAQYADARLTVVEREMWFVGDRDKPLQSFELYGFGVRALRNGCWGFFSSAHWTPDEAVRLGKSAAAQAGASVRGAAREVSLGTIPPVVNGTWTMPVKYDPFTVSLAEKADYMDMIRGVIHRQSPLVAGALGATFQRTRKYFASSEGSSWAQTSYITEGDLSVRYGAEYGYNITSGGGASAQTLTPAGQGWEYIAESGLPEQIPALVELARESRQANILEVGRYTVVCAPFATAAMLTESIGAATELDRAMGYEANAGGTSFVDQPLEMLGTYQMGSSMLNVSAERSRIGAAATVKWDDEGVVPDEFSLVAGGVLTDYQTTREQAAWLAPYYSKMGKSVRSHGCAGAPSGINVTLQQPPNLRIHGGAKDLSFDDLVAGTDKGIAVLGVNLMMDPQRLNGIGFGTYREIKNGKLGRFLAGGVLGIRTPELWKNLTAIGGDSATRWYGMRREKGEPEQLTFHGVGAVPAKFANVAVVNFTGRM